MHGHAELLVMQQCHSGSTAADRGPPANIRRRTGRTGVPGPAVSDLEMGMEILTQVGSDLALTLLFNATSTDPVVQGTEASSPQSRSLAGFRMVMELALLERNSSCLMLGYVFRRLAGDIAGGTEILDIRWIPWDDPDGFVCTIV